MKYLITGNPGLRTSLTGDRRWNNLLGGLFTAGAIPGSFIFVVTIIPENLDSYFVLLHRDPQISLYNFTIHNGHFSRPR